MTNGKKNIVRFVSGTGWAYVSASLAFLAAGILRGELISTICGATLFSYALFSFLTTLLARAAWTHAAVSAEWKDTGVLSLALFTAKKPRFFSLLFTEVLYCVDYATSDEAGTGRVFPVRIPVAASVAEHRLELPPRGVYTAANAHLRIRDYSGFFTLAIRLPQTNLPAPLTVPPRRVPDTNAGIPPGKTGLTRGKSSFRRSEDLYETRSYRPGDDPRKINWKVYAHSGELTVRQGELLPPPANEYVFLLYSGNPQLPSGRAKDRFDILLSRAARLALRLLAENRSVTIVAADGLHRIRRTTVHPSESGAAGIAAAAFAVPQLRTRDHSVEQYIAAAGEKDTRLFFALPGQISGMALSPAGFRNTTLYLGPVPENTVPRSAHQKIRDFLFLRETDNTGEEAPIFGHDLQRTETRLKREGFHVKKI